MLIERIKLLCERDGISLGRLSAQLGFSKNTLYTWEKSAPSVDKLIKVADYFDVSLDYLAGRTDDPRPQRALLGEGATLLYKTDTGQPLEPQQWEKVREYIAFLETQQEV